MARNGAFLRWNLTPSYTVFRSPYLLLFDDAGGRAEVRDVTTGRMCEVIDHVGMKPLRQSRNDQTLLALRPQGLLELVEVSVASVWGADMEDCRVVIVDCLGSLFAVYCVGPVLLYILGGF